MSVALLPFLAGTFLACTPPPKPGERLPKAAAEKAPARVETPSTGRSEPRPAQTQPKIRVERIDTELAAISAAKQSRASLARPPAEPPLTQLSVAPIILAPVSPPAVHPTASVPQSPRAAEPAQGATQASSTGAIAKNSAPVKPEQPLSEILGHPRAALPIPENARLEAGRLANTPIDKTAPVKPASTPVTPLKNVGAGESKQESFFLEAAFITLVLVCIIGAMWFHMNSDVSRNIRRPREWR